MEVLVNSSLKENKLKRHLTSKHPNLINKPLSFWKDKIEGVKRMRLDRQSTSWKIAKCKKPHNIGGQLVKPAAVVMPRIVCEEEVVKKIYMTRLFNNTIKRRIDLISEDILYEIITLLRKSKKFSSQKDESVDIEGYPELMVYVRCNGYVKYYEEFLFCNLLETTTKGDDIFLDV